MIKKQSDLYGVIKDTVGEMFASILLNKGEANKSNKNGVSIKDFYKIVNDSENKSGKVLVLINSNI